MFQVKKQNKTRQKNHEMTPMGSRVSPRDFGMTTVTLMAYLFGQISIRTQVSAEIWVKLQGLQGEW